MTDENENRADATPEESVTDAVSAAESTLDDGAEPDIVPGEAPPLVEGAESEREIEVAVGEKLVEVKNLKIGRAHV